MPSGRIPSLSFEYVILSLLTSRAKHGYEIYKEMEAWPGLGEVWKLKQSMLYADLIKLEKLAYLESMPPDLEYSPPRVNFKITEKGRTALENWVTTPVQRPRDIRPEFLAKLLVASRLGRECAKNLINLQKAKAREWIESESAQENASPAYEPQVAMILNFRSHWLKNVVDWLDACLTLLEIDR